MNTRRCFQNTKDDSNACTQCKKKGMGGAGGGLLWSEQINHEAKNDKKEDTIFFANQRKVKRKLPVVSHSQEQVINTINRPTDSRRYSVCKVHGVGVHPAGARMLLGLLLLLRREGGAHAHWHPHSLLLSSRCSDHARRLLLRAGLLPAKRLLLLLLLA